MPKFDMPVDDTDSVDSSILSFSSNENGAASNRSLSCSISSGPASNLSPPLLMVERKSPQPPPKPFDPIVDLHSVCQEPTIDAVLRKACKGSNLDQLTHIEMRVTPNVFGLHQMHVFLPNLVALNLDGSYLESLRDLGCDLKLKYLNVSRCRLRTFDGISGFDMVENLIADDNNISNIMPLSGLHELHTLSLRGNRLKQINAIDFLITCKNLNNLELTNNAITTTSDYRQKVKTALPALLILDGFGFDEPITCGATGNLTECSSSLTSDLSKDSGSSLSDRICDSNTVSRPMSGQSVGQFVIDSTMPMTITSMKRPSTTGSSSCCSIGEPIVGNIINKVRCRNRRRHHCNDIKTSTSMLDSSSKCNSLNSDSFSQPPPPPLSQIPVPLELGVIDTEPIIKSDSNQEQTQEEDMHQLIELCRRWRELSRKSRESHHRTN